MLIIPAIDIMQGKVVRLVQGKTGKTVYSSDPVMTAKHWQRQGAKLLHLVDLDGAIKGKMQNFRYVQEIARAVSIPVEFGGGIRTQADIKRLLDAGIYRVVLGTRAIEAKFLEKVLKKYKDRVIVSVDARQDSVLIKGWKKGAARVSVDKLLKSLKKSGLKEIIFTDVNMDGTLKGPNIKKLKQLLKTHRIRIIASGGVSCLQDLMRLKMLEKDGLSGVIIGKALYEAKFTLPEAAKYS
ncbi:MAG: 1-(5-phosphoribosyl)-5-[(5-phosphoribosylamino)methylideneamino]imidazole-4-carboxamide isomerase [Candidatus Omnitrophota bacterium]|jgi:phosphoribosylformimino-5-aminoimidazole carboxamide ribotide isomerase|nr:MAG: 1-(5-phosphoribosyl)-5-[(5-phosphoribosylamino)methylideneamino]imidazole-4-carboxamide isomerase [Candidatus Omnitrophota bacterium]